MNEHRFAALDTRTKEPHATPPPAAPIARAGRQLHALFVSLGGGSYPLARRPVALTRQRSSTIGGASAALLAAVVLAGCGGEISVGGGGADRLTRDQVQKRIVVLLRKEVGQTPPEPTCPDGLPAKVGSTMRCTITFPDGLLDVDVKVTEVRGKEVRFDVEAADAMRPKP